MLHHAYIDKIWAEWNASANAAYLQPEMLSQSPWHYQFYNPSEDGSPQIKNYSDWGSNVGGVITGAYNPNYSYNRLNDITKEGKPNPVLALLDRPSFRPAFDVTPIQKSVEDVAYQSIELGITRPFKAKDVLRLRELGISFTMELS